MTRPVLIGMNNPLSSDPEHALYPHPPGCTGHRLFSMLLLADQTVTDDEYLECFDRRNLIGGRAWPTGQGHREFKRDAAKTMLDSVRGRDVVLLGKEVQTAFGFGKYGEMSDIKMGTTRWVMVPHPSGLCRWYNVPGNSEKVGALLAGMLRTWRAAQSRA